MLYLSPTQERLRDDIRGLIKGEVRCDEVTLQLYSTDGGILQSRPQGVVYPRDIEDVSATVKYAAERSIPIHARGMGTGKCGGSLGEGIVIDFSRFMRQIISLGHDYVIVQPGIVRYRLNELLSRIQNRVFAPASGFEPTATVGGMIARNGAGGNWLQYGFPSDHVLELKIVLANGTVLTLDRRNLPEAIDSDSVSNIPITSANPALKGKNLAYGIAFARGLVLGKEHTVADGIYRILNPSFLEIRSMNTLPPISSAGYAVNKILKGSNGHHVDIAGLIAGSEGTLGLIVEAKLRTVSVPMRRAGAVLFFDSLENAARAVKIIQSFNPVLCELFDRRQLSMSLEWKPSFRNILPMYSEAALLIELNAGTLEMPLDSMAIKDQMSQLLDNIMVKEAICKKSLRIESPEQFVLFDEFRHRGLLVLYQMRQSVQPLSIFDDIAIPVSVLQDFMRGIISLLKKHEITASLSGHIGQGHIRVTPIIDLAQHDFVQQLRNLAGDVYMFVIGLGGCITSDSGDGLLKSHFLPQQFPSLMPVFRNIKELFDPNYILNPGKIIPDNTIWTQHLRSGLKSRGSNHPENFDTSVINLDDNLSGLFLLDAQKRESEIVDENNEENNNVNNNPNNEEQPDNESNHNDNDNNNGDNNGNLTQNNNTAIHSPNVADFAQQKQDTTPSQNTTDNNADENVDNNQSKTDNATARNSGGKTLVRDQLELQIKWEPEHFFEATYLCNGCGDCLRLDRRVRMCPIFRRHPEEAAAPRGKANLLRGVLEGEFDLQVLVSERSREIAEFCLHCRMCEVECPASVKVSQLAFNCKGFHAAANGLALEDIFLSRIDTVLRVAAMVSCPVNWLMSNRAARWVLEKLFQISKERMFPQLAKISFLTKTKWSQRIANVVHSRNATTDNFKKNNTNSDNTNSDKTDSGDTDSGNTDSGNIDSDNTDSVNIDSVNIDSDKVVSGEADSGFGSGSGSGSGSVSNFSSMIRVRRVALFVDTYINHFETRLAELSVRVLEHNGFEVYVPVRQRSSGLPAFSLGNRDRAERLARHNTLLFADLVRQGYQVVTIEPASASCMLREYCDVLGESDVDVSLLVSNVLDICNFLYQADKSGVLRRDFRAVHWSVGYHAPCRAIINSVKRLDVPTPAEVLLGLIPELSVRRIEKGCCGMAGMFGVKIRNYHRSLQIGLPIAKELRGIDFDIGATDCTACKIQLEQCTKKKIYHPITLLAIAYQLISERE